MPMKVGDAVVKNPKEWKSNNYDSVGRGVGVGIVTSDDLAKFNQVDVRWGDCTFCEYANSVVLLSDLINERKKKLLKIK